MPHSMTARARASEAIRASISASLASASARLVGRPGASSANNRWTSSSVNLRAEVAKSGVRVVLIEPTRVRTRFVESQLQAMHSYADDDPHGEFS